MPVPAAKQRVVLAALLLRANQVVSFDELAEIVWGGKPPDWARTTVRNYVRRLRLGLGPAVAARIVTRAPGYLIEVSPDEVDLLCFTGRCDDGAAALRGGEWQRALGALDEALGLWRGVPLADVESSALQRDEVPRLEELRLQALEWRADAGLQLGRSGEMVAALRVLAAQHPLRERFHAQLMLALYRSGRQAEALGAYQQARRLLRDELGLEPGAELRDLHDRVLRADPGLAADPGRITGRSAEPRPGLVAPRQLPAPTTHFVGRAAELSELSRVLDASGTDGRTLVITAIGGTAGVGKTALAVRWAHQVADRFPDGQLYVNMRGFDPSGSPAGPAEALGDFLGALGVPADRIPVGLDARAALYRSLLAGQRTLVVVDNAADEQQVRPLLSGGPGCLVIVTSRSLLAGLVASEGARPLTLDVLTAGEAQDLLARHLSAGRLAAEPAAAAELTGWCARLPLALAIVAARAATRPGLPLAALAAELRDAPGRLDALAAGDVATSVRAVFSWSYQVLSQPAAQMFRLLAVHRGPDISLPAAASLAGLPARQARLCLGELTRAHLLAEHVPGRYACHDLLRTYAAERASADESPQARRAAVHRVLDHYLHTACSVSGVLNPARDPLGLDSPRGGSAPEDITTPEQALAWFDAEHRVLLAAIALAADSGHDRHAWQLPVSLALIFMRQGHWPDWAATQHAALAAARRLGDRAGQARAQRSLGRACLRLRSYDDALAHLSQALDLYSKLGDRVGQGLIHLDLAHLHEEHGRYDDTLAHARNGLGLFEAAGYLTGQAGALNTAGWSHIRLGNYQQALACCQEALGLHHELGDRSGEAETWDSLGYAHHHLGDHARAVTCYQQALRLFHQAGDRCQEAATNAHLGDTWHASGDRPAARAAWQAALAILDDLRRPDADQIRARLRGNS